MLGGYTTGTISIAAGAVVATGSGVIWNSANAREGDTLIVAGHQVIINSVNDVDELGIDAWPFSAVTNVAYRIAYTSPLRYGANAQLAKDVSAVLAVLNATGFFVFVGIDETEPDPSLGEDGQFALQPSTMKRWHKEGGLWVFEGYFGGFGAIEAYDNGTTYALFDMVSLNGSTYQYINSTPSAGHPPPNATYWIVMAAKGADGAAATIDVGTVTTLNPGASATVSNSGSSSAAELDFGIPSGKGYGGSSTSSVAIGTATGTRIFNLGTTIAYAYQIGDYVRAKSAANGANFVEGFVLSYTGGVLQVGVMKVGGTGTFTDWNVSLSGAPGTGDVLSANNGTEFNAATFASNLSLLRYAAQSLTAAQQSQARANIGLMKENKILNSALMVSQRNGSLSGTTNGYSPVDNFQMLFSNAGTQTIQQVTSLTPGGSPNRLRLTATVADASVSSTDFLLISTKLEASKVADLRSGTATAKQVTLQFGCKGPAGIYSLALRNGAYNRSYVAEFVIAGGEANTDVVKSVTFTLDQTGTWAIDNSIGFDITWCFMAGTAYYTSLNSWNAINAVASSNQFNFMGMGGNVFELFDIGLYEGSAAPAFQVPYFDDELRKCWRYLFVLSSNVGASTFAMATGLNATSCMFNWLFPVPMRAAPNCSATGSGAFRTQGPVSTGISSFAFSGNSPQAVRGIATVSSGLTAGQCYGIEIAATGTPGSFIADASL